MFEKLNRDSTKIQNQTFIDKHYNIWDGKYTA